MLKLNIQMFAEGSQTLVGSLNGSSAAYAQFYAIRSYTQDEENAITTETIKLYLKRVSSVIYSYNDSAPYTIQEVITNADGTTKTNTLKSGNCSFNLGNVSVGGSALLTTYTRELTHDENGAYATYTLKATLTTEVSLGNGTISKSVSTPTISTSYPVSIQDLDISKNNVLNITVGSKESSNYTYDLSYRIGASDDKTPLEGVIATDLTTSPKLWELSDDLILELKNKMSDTASLPIIIYCTTKKDGVQIGTIKQSTANILISEIPINNAGTYEEQVENIRTLTNSKYVVKDLSKLKFTLNITPPTGTTIKKYYVDVGDSSGTSRTIESDTNEVTIENIVENIDGKTNLFTYGVDARGNKSETWNLSLPFIDYIKAEYVNTECTVKRTEGDIDKIEVNLKANFFNELIGETSNVLTLGYKYKEKGTDVYKTGTSSLSLDTDITLDETFDHTKNYEIVFTINDLIYTGSEMTKSIATSQYVMLEHEKGVDFLNVTIMGKQVAKLEDISSSKVIQQFVDGNKSYTSNKYIAFTLPDIDTTDTIIIDDEETKEVVFESSGLITINYVGLVKISANLWVNGSSSSSRPWISIRDYTNSKNIASVIDDTSSQYTSFTFPDVYINNKVAGTQYGFLVSSVTGSLTLNAGSGGNNSYCNIQLL